MIGPHNKTLAKSSIVPEENNSQPLGVNVNNQYKLFNNSYKYLTQANKNNEKFMFILYYPW